MSVNTVIINKPKGEALGFKVSNTMREQIIDVVDFLESLSFKLTMFRVIENEAAEVEYTNDTGGFTQRFVMIPNCTVYQESGIPICWSKSTWESKGFYFDNSDEMYESVDEIYALNVNEYDTVEALRGILEWCRGNGLGLENFGIYGNGVYSIMADGYESEEFGRNDYVSKMSKVDSRCGLKRILKAKDIRSKMIFRFNLLVVPVSTCVLWFAVMLLYTIANPKLNCSIGVYNESRTMGNIWIYNDCSYDVKRRVRDSK